MESVRRLAPVGLLVVGAGLVATGVILWPHRAGYVSPHPWADYLTLGVIAASAGLFDLVRRPLRERNYGAAEMAVVATGLAIIVAAVILAVASLVHGLS